MTHLDATQEAILDQAYDQWRKGNYYIYEGDFYDVETGSYICPTE